MQGLIQFIKFGLVGVMNTAVDFLVYALLTWLGMQYLVAQVFSYSAGTLNSYVVNKLWTFGGKAALGGEKANAGKVDKGEFARFVLVNLATLLLSIGLLYILKTGLGFHPLVAKIGVTAVTVVVNYIGSKLWVFRGQ
ncbi:GtrA family protein [Paenibacillus sp. YN15]|nr:GtrA family protein [Paenibacillus sp. YN15]